MKKFLILLFLFYFASCENNVQQVSFCDLDLKNNEFWLYNQCEVKRNVVTGTYIAVFNHLDEFPKELYFDVVLGEAEWGVFPATEFKDSCEAKQLIDMFVKQEILENKTDPRYSPYIKI